jgi:collagenase-like PrtC family protease
VELICPAGTPIAFRAAVDAGADAVYCGFNDETNARNFPGLNFSREELANAVAYARPRGSKVFVAINTFPRAGDTEVWRQAVDDAVDLDADALILADIGLLDYAAHVHRGHRLHLSVQAAAANVDSIRYFVDAFQVRRVVLPRVLSVPEIALISAAAVCETEVFVFGGLCVMEEGRCSLSSYATGLSPNMNGVCSPASHVAYRKDGEALVSRLGNFTINRFEADEAAAYPTLCKGRFRTARSEGYLFEDPVSLDAAALLPALRQAGVAALKIEGRQRGRAYVDKVVRSFKAALAALERDELIPAGELTALMEGQSATTGAYRKAWR